MRTWSWSKVGTFAFIGVCIAFGQNCTKEVSFYAEDQKLSGLSGGDPADRVVEVGASEDLEFVVEQEIDDLDPENHGSLDDVKQAELDEEIEQPEQTDRADQPVADNKERKSDAGKHGHDDESSIEPTVSNEEVAEAGPEIDKEDALRACMKSISGDIPQTAVELISGLSIVENNRGRLDLGAYEQVSIYDNRGKIHIDYADFVPEFFDHRGAASLSARAVGSVDNVRGVLCLAVEEGIANLSNVRGKVIIVGTGSSPAVIENVENVRGKIVLYNATISNLGSARGKVAGK